MNNKALNNLFNNYKKIWNVDKYDNVHYLLLIAKYYKNLNGKEDPKSEQILSTLNMVVENFITFGHKYYNSYLLIDKTPEEIKVKIEKMAINVLKKIKADKESTTNNIDNNLNEFINEQ